MQSPAPSFSLSIPPLTFFFRVNFFTLFHQLILSHTSPFLPSHSFTSVKLCSPHFHLLLLSCSLFNQATHPIPPSFPMLDLLNLSSYLSFRSPPQTALAHICLTLSFSRVCACACLEEIVWKLAASLGFYPLLTSVECSPPTAQSSSQ